MKTHWRSAALGVAAIMLAGVAAAAPKGGNHAGNGNQHFGGMNGGGSKFTPRFNPPTFNPQAIKPQIAQPQIQPLVGRSNGVSNGKPGIVPKLGGGANNGGLGIQLGNVASHKPINIHGPKLDKIGIQPADLGQKFKPIDPGFNKPGANKPGGGVVKNGANNAQNGVGLGLGIGLGVLKDLMGSQHHHCHDFCQPNYCWPSSCVSVNCGTFVCPQPVYYLPTVEVIEVVTVIELPVVVPAAPPQPTTDVQPVSTEVPAAPLAPAETAADDTTRSAGETAAAPVAEADLIRVPVGGSIELKGQDLGATAGQVLVQVGDLMLPATMKEWKPDLVKAELPRIGVVQPTKAMLHVVKPDGKFASSVPCLLIAPPQPAK